MPDTNRMVFVVDDEAVIAQTFAIILNQADLLEKARAEGYDFDLLLKPVHPADLVAKLRV